MKKIFTLTLLCVALLWKDTSAQCPIVTPNNTGCTPAGGLCNGFDTAMANQPYQTVVNFLMPKRLTDASTLSQCQCNYVELKTIKISGIGGLPTGLNYTFNKSLAPYKGYYDVTNNDTIGSVTICGTPLSPGSYPVTVYIEANVLAVGTPIGNVDPGPQNQTYQGVLVVLPDTSGSIASFDFFPKIKEDCDSLRLSFDAKIVPPTPNFATYEWSFGNGATSTDKTPTGTQFYSTPGLYPVVLKTTTHKFVLQSVTIDQATNTSCWQDFCDIACAGTPPDIYITIPALSFNNKQNEVSDCTNINFNNINGQIAIGTTSILLRIWDDDGTTGALLCGGTDDDLGTYTINIDSRYLVQPFSGSCASGHVNFIVVDDAVFIDTLWVNIKGRPAIPTILAASDTFCNNDSATLTLANSYTGSTFQWYKDNGIINGATDSIYKIGATGTYKVEVTNVATGCNSVYEKHYTFMASPANPMNTIFNQSLMKIYLGSFVDLTQFGIKWYKDGLEIPSQTTSTISYLGNGSYNAVIYNKLYPLCSTTSNTVVVNYNGVEDNAINASLLEIFPNPTKGNVTVKFDCEVPQEITCRIADIYGRIVAEKIEKTATNNFVANFDNANTAKGIYLVTIQSNGKVITKKLVVE